MGSAWLSGYLEYRAPMVSRAECGHEVPVAVRAAPTEVPETKNVVHQLGARIAGWQKEWFEETRPTAWFSDRGSRCGFAGGTTLIVRRGSE